MKELKPSNAVGIVETDLNVDFDAPVGYDEKAARAGAAGGAGAGGTGGAGGAGESGATGAIGGPAMNMPAPVSGGSGTLVVCSRLDVGMEDREKGCFRSSTAVAFVMKEKEIVRLTI